MWSVARYDLGLTSEDFYALTPRQFDALVKRRERDAQEQEFLTAQLTAAVVNFSMCHPKEPVSPRDFMPSEFGKPARKPKRVRITKKLKRELALSVRAGFAAMRK
jgi:hypothetical protein